MKNRPLIALVLAGFLLGPLAAYASDAEGKLDPAPIDLRDAASLQAGARTFVNNCLNCHSASLVRYNRLRDLGLTDQQIRDSLMFTAEKTGEMMNVAMTKKDAAEWFGAVPPDLSLTARSRGADWLYTYLRGFYRDPTSATGWNNTTFDRVGMPHVLWQLQGEQVLRTTVTKDAAGKETGKTQALEMVAPGTLSPAEYDATVRDLVNFMAWMAEPNQVFRKQVGWWVLAFVFLLIILTYLLKREFWKDVH